METIQQDTSNKVIQKDGFDEQTQSHFQSLLVEIDRKQQQSSYQRTASGKKTKYIKFTFDKEHKVLSFTGNVSKLEVPTKEFETGLEIPDRYVTRYLFECYGITNTAQNQETNGSPAIWECGQKMREQFYTFFQKAWLIGSCPS